MFVPPRDLSAKAMPPLGQYLSRLLKRRRADGCAQRTRLPAPAAEQAVVMQVLLPHKGCSNGCRLGASHGHHRAPCADSWAAWCIQPKRPCPR
jgi:hypothetical protein